MLFRVLLITLFFTGPWLSAPAVAHDPEPTPFIKQYKLPAGPGAQGKFQMKMDVAEQTIRLFITDQFDQPVDVGLASATAFLAINGSTTMLQLVPEADNVLSAEAFFAPDPALQVHVTLRLPGRRPVNQVFTPLRKSLPAGLCLLDLYSSDRLYTFSKDQPMIGADIDGHR